MEDFIEGVVNVGFVVCALLGLIMFITSAIWVPKLFLIYVSFLGVLGLGGLINYWRKRR